MVRIWDYKEEYKQLRSSILKSLDDVFNSGTLICGDNVRTFEKTFSKYINNNYGIGVANGTDALYVSMKAFGISSESEVITVSNTAIPTTTAIAMTGADPVFVDVNKYFLMDASKIEDVITEKTAAILPVHLYGQICDMREINRIASKYNILVIEDCAQAHGATQYNEKAGSFGDVGAFSFYPTKVLGAYGDGGFITTDSRVIYSKMNRLRFFGINRNEISENKWDGKYYAQEDARNTCTSRLNEVQAAILNEKLKYLEEYIRQRREIANRYTEELSDTDLLLPLEAYGNKHVYYMYVVMHDDRDRIIKSMLDNDISLNVSYPYPIHTMLGYKYLNYKYGDLPVTESFSDKIFSLPIYPNLTYDDQSLVINALKKII